MQGDFTRWTYDPGHTYRSVLMQQGRVILDAEWNEQAEVTAHHDEARTRDVVGRAGGPAPLDGGPGGFALVNGVDASKPDGVAWSELVVTPGSYYVDGVLAEAMAPPAGDTVVHGWPLSDQPFLATIEPDDTGLPEPPDEPGQSRYVVYLDVWSHHVTVDEEPGLREPALGGPDTSTRERTVWQVRVAPIEDDELCSTLSRPGWQDREPRLMAAGLRPASDDDDPCQINTAGGYQRLENQLYRVQIHDGGPHPTFLWSRENGSVTAGLLGIGATTQTGMDAVLTLDRVGRDEELSIGQGSVVEVTSTDRQLRGLPGFLARAGEPDDLELPVHWLDTAPGSVQALGKAPIVRRWEAEPAALSATGVDLEGGIFVRFPAGGSAVTGDYWLVPARTVRLAYGVNALRGTLDWPESTTSPPTPLALPPRGPVHHLAPLAVLARTGSTWTRESDCRALFPPLTRLVSLDLIGGDGQESMPGRWLPVPVRVAVRNGGLPVTGATVLFRAPGSQLDQAATPTGGPDNLSAETDEDGVASVHWLLDPAGDTTQALSAQLLDDQLNGTGVEVIVSGRLSVAREVAWDPVCSRLADGSVPNTTVQYALDRLATTADLRLLGGDGQQVGANQQTVPQLVRVVVDSPCGPVGEASVTATTRGRTALTLAVRDGDDVPETLVDAGAEAKATAVTDDDGVAAFVWQPGFDETSSDVLDISVDGASDAPIRVSAQLVPPGRRTPGVHITQVRLASGPELLNDTQIAVSDLVQGIMIDLDGAVVQNSVRGKPVVRVELDLPWPAPSDGDVWNSEPVGTRRIELGAETNADGELIVWSPFGTTREWLLERIWSVLADLHQNSVLARLIVDGWAIVSSKDPRLHLNGHASMMTANQRLAPTVLQLPTDDEVTGGQFVLWFRLAREAGPRPDRVVLEDLRQMTRARAERVLAESGLVLGDVVEERALGVRKNTVLGTVPEAGSELDLGTAVTLRVSLGRGE